MRTRAKKDLNMIEAKISFSVFGSVRQSVEITKEGLTIRELQLMLNNGTALTTVQDDGEIVVTATGEVLGRVVEGMDLAADLEYIDFEVYTDR
jgi:hypothetical protein